jgi:hypothetical protein
MTGNPQNPIDALGGISKPAAGSTRKPRWEPPVLTVECASLAEAKIPVTGEQNQTVRIHS